MKRLRAAGAVILGKANLTEFANILTIDMPSGYSSIAGQVKNPYVPDRFDKRGIPVVLTGGSSAGSGVSVAAGLCAAAIGTETSGSILSPANQCMLVGIKPTVGRVSRHGVIPITGDQDTAGPIARTVTDAAIVLSAIAGYDPADPATQACLTPGNWFADYTQFLDRRDARGVAGAFRHRDASEGPGGLSPEGLRRAAEGQAVDGEAPASRARDQDPGAPAHRGFEAPPGGGGYGDPLERAPERERAHVTADETEARGDIGGKSGALRFGLGEHAGGDVIRDMAVDHPRAGVVGDHVRDLHAPGQQLHDVGAPSLGHHRPTVPVR